MAKFPIPGKKKDHGPADPDIEVDVGGNYEAYSKSVPDQQTPYENFMITWFNNFGVRDKTTKKNANVTYKVKLKKLPEGKRLFALYKDSPTDAEPTVHEITPEDDGPNNIKFTLNVGDPPLGTGP